MNKNLEKISTDLFGKIRSQFDSVKLGNEQAQVTDKPKDARFFEFNFEKNEASLGSVTVHLNDEENSLVVMYSNDITQNQPESIKKIWFDFLRELKEFAKKRLMNFEARDILKKLDHRDYKFLAKDEGAEPMAESKLWGTTKTSYQNMGESRIVVKHTQMVNGEVPQGRSQHIDSIYIENAQGERFKYPFKHLNGARAMARHVANGGTPYDSIGEHVIGLSEELSKLRMFKGYVSRNPVVSESMNTIQSKVMERIDGIKKQIHQLQSQGHYTQFAESFTSPETKEIPEDVMNDWIDRLTIRTFNEELKNVFPYIYKLIDEDSLPVKELTAADFETSADEKIVESSKTGDSALEEYESYLDSLIEDSNIFKGAQVGDSAIQKLNQLFEKEFPVGADGSNAIQSLTDIIDDPELNDVLKEYSDISPELDARPVIMSYIKLHDEENGTEIASQIKFETGELEVEMPDQEPVAPEEPVAPDAAPEETVPPTESINNNNRFAQKFEALKKAGATPDTQFEMGGQKLTLKDAIEMAGLQLEDFFNDKTSESEEQITEFVKSMYDHHTGAFPKGETGVVLAVEKQFGKPATKIAVETIKSLRQVYESNRMKKLAGILK